MKDETKFMTKFYSDKMDKRNKRKADEAQRQQSLISLTDKAYAIMNFIGMSFNYVVRKTCPFGRRLLPSSSILSTQESYDERYQRLSAEAVLRGYMYRAS